MCWYVRHVRHVLGKCFVVLLLNTIACSVKASKDEQQDEWFFRKVNGDETRREQMSRVRWREESDLRSSIDSEQQSNSLDARQILFWQKRRVKFQRSFIVLVLEA